MARSCRATVSPPRPLSMMAMGSSGCTTRCTSTPPTSEVRRTWARRAPGGDGPPARRAPTPYRTDSRENLDICQFERETRAYHTFAAPAEETHTMSTALDGKKVLLVDDDNDILTSMQAAFEPTGA